MKKSKSPLRINHKNINRHENNLRYSCKPRLNATRNRLSTKNPDLVDVLKNYEVWVNYTEWLVFQGLSPLYQLDKTEYLPAGNVAVELPAGSVIFDVSYKVAKASKRGNDVYLWRVKKRLKLLHKAKGMPSSLGFFSRGVAKPLTAALFITLTYNPAGASMGEAWEGVGAHFDKWRARIRSKYGKFEFVRCWEAQKNGYPHIHILLVFQDAEFNVFRYNRKWRITEKVDFEWKHGFVDVQACKDLKDGVSYIAKYIGKAHNLGSTAGGGEGNLTLSLTWFYRKRSWSLSRAFNDLIRGLHNPNRIASDFLHRDDDEDIEWFLVGFYGGYPLQLILEDAVLGFTRSITRYQFRDIYGSPGWGDFRYKRAVGDDEAGSR